MFVHCRKALNDWWEEKAKEADLQAEQNIKNGRGGSILKSLKITKQSKIKYVHRLLDAINWIFVINIEMEKLFWNECKRKFNCVTHSIWWFFSSKDEPWRWLEGTSRLPPIKPELETALKQCKSNTAAGIDDLNSNMLKLGVEATVN